MMNPTNNDPLLADLRQGVRQLCQHYPDAYWRELDERE